MLHELIQDLPAVCAITSVSGKVCGIQGQTILARLPHASLGDICHIETPENRIIHAQVVSFNDDIIYLAPFSETRGISPGCKVIKDAQKFSIDIPDVAGGLIMDALGNILYKDPDEKNKSKIKLELFNTAPCALSRAPVREQLVTGVRSIDTLCGIGYGQRLGLFAAAGLGKSTLLGMFARGAEADVNVIALSGERGREVKEFIDENLGDEGLRKSIIVVATSDKPAMQRSLAGITATSIAEHFRSRGKRVLLLVDSLTRMARAIRDVSLSAGEIPIRQGLTSSVFSELPKLIERAGNDDKGSITAIYTLLDSSEYESDPLAEEVKSLLDGHICLDSQIALKGIRPAVDFTRSISRCLNNIFNKENLAMRDRLLRIIAKLNKEKDLIMLGGVPDTELRACLALEPKINDFLKQNSREKIDKEASLSLLREILRQFDSALTLKN